MIIGIDLGTTIHCVAYIDGGATLLSFPTWKAAEPPSMVAITEAENVSSDKCAKEASDYESEHTVFASKG